MSRMNIINFFSLNLKEKRGHSTRSIKYIQVLYYGSVAHMHIVENYFENVFMFWGDDS